MKGSISSPSTDSACSRNRQKSKFSELFTNRPPTSRGAAHSRAVVGFLQAPANPRMNNLSPLSADIPSFSCFRGVENPCRLPLNRPAIRLPHSAPSSPPITILIARRKTIILRIAPERPVLSASVPALPFRSSPHLFVGSEHPMPKFCPEQI